MPRESYSPRFSNIQTKGISQMTFKSRKQSLLLFPGFAFVNARHPECRFSAPLPNPVLYLTGIEPYQTGGKQFIRYKYDVLNKDAYRRRCL